MFESGSFILFSEECQIAIVLLLFVCGTCFGSFLNCIAMRTVRRKNWISGRSRCPECHHVLKLRDLIPVFSYLFLKGRCRYCGSRIRLRYLTTELFMGIVWVHTYLMSHDLISFIFYLILFSLFFCLSLIDLESNKIPDIFIVLILINWFGLSLCRREFEFNNILSSFLLTAGIYISVLLMEKLSGKECMGRGDIKLIFVVCLYTGFYRNIIVLFLSSLIGLMMVFMNGKRKIPFGPCICLAAALVILYGDQMIKYMFL